MSLDLHFAEWSSLARAAGNHVWQSTLFAIAAGFLAWLFRRNRARVRYALWLAASLKFLVPIALLVGLGSRLAAPHASSAAGDRFYVEISQFGQPFLPASPPAVPNPNPPTAGSARPGHLLALLLAAIWCTGFAAVLAIWGAGWRRVRVILGESEPMRAGRELDSLRRLERISGKPRPLAAVVSRASLEPGIFGLVRPVLIWPAGISAHFEDPHLEAVLAHELCHVRRRDNLTAALHMVVEAVFWFHPLVWWIGARLGEERERACDEQVMALGSPPRVYAESILKTCEFCVEAPLACVSGVAGDDLKQRIVRIMDGRFAQKLSLARKLVLSAFAAAWLAGPVVFGMLHSTRVEAQSASGESSSLAFVVSIKPNRSGKQFWNLSNTPDGFSATGIPVKSLILFAYQVKEFQLSGAPSWIDSERYDIEARLDEATITTFKKLAPEETLERRRRMMRSLLEERFHLKVNHWTKELPAYALVVAKNGPRLVKSSDSPSGSREPGGGMIRFKMGELTATGISLDVLADQIAHEVGRPVVDKTGLEGRYDFTLDWTSDRQALTAGPADSERPAQPVDPSGPSMFTALQKQLGLKLESLKAPIETLIIESIERPSEN